MGELDRGPERNINVTLGQQSQGSALEGKVFPCCICSANLDIRLSKRGKPYCTCVQCGIQIFFRGQVGISRLNKIIENGILIAGKDSSANLATVLFNRISHLKAQKANLDAKQGLIFVDPDLANAIRSVDIEIKRVQGELEKLARKTPQEKTR